MEVNNEADVLSVLSQVASELVEVLVGQPDDVQTCLLRHMQHVPRPARTGNQRDRILQLVDHFTHAQPDECRRFIHTITMVCDNLPMALESHLLSAAGCDDPHPPPPQKPEMPEYRNQQPADDCPTPLKQKRDRKDSLETYHTSVKKVLLQQYEQVMQGVVRNVQLEQVRVSLRRSLGRSRDAEEGATESVVPVESFFTAQPGVTVLLGPAGSGKTLVTHYAAWRWANRNLPKSVRLLFFFEFRQLNMLPDTLSLSDLLFHFFLSPEQEDSENILAFVLENPKQVWLIFDGYDEFRSRFTPPVRPSGPFDPQEHLTVSELFSGLCSGRILPGSSIMVTCRARDMFDLPDNDLSQVGELLGFDQQRVREYAEHYFQGKTHCEHAVNVLLKSRHLLSMSSIPALCFMCCVCLDHLLTEEPHKLSLPETVTQVYIQILNAFISRCPGSVVRGSSVPPLQGHKMEVQELSRLALQGLDEHRVVFWKSDIPQNILDFAMAAGLLSPLKLRQGDGSWHEGCAFVHLTMQEFLGALHLMTSEDTIETDLRKRLNLKTRWTARTQPKTVFTDSLQLFLCGLTSSACCPYLLQLARGPRAQGCVQHRQGVVLKVLQSLGNSASLTGPKALELCRCAYETQNLHLAEILASRSRFELRNITLTLMDMEALTFVISAGGQGVGLDFGGCSMELECLEVLASSWNISYLIFRSRKYEDRFAEVLSGILPRLTSLRRLEFISGNLTDAGAEKLAIALGNCPGIAELNLSDNMLMNRGVSKIADVLPKMTSLTTVHLGKNGLSLDGVLYVVEKMTSCPNIQRVHVVGNKEIKELKLSLSQDPDAQSVEDAPGRIVSLLNCTFTPDEMQKLCLFLARCFGLSVIDLSGGVMKDDALQVLVDWLPQLSVSREVVMNSTSLTMNGLSALSRSVTDCPAVAEVNIRRQDPIKVSIMFSTETQNQTLGEKTAKQDLVQSKKLRLSECDLRSSHVDKLYETLRGCQGLTLLDLSSNALGNQGLKKLMDLLPHLTAVQEINVSENGVTMPGVLAVAEAFCSHRSMRAVDITNIHQHKTPRCHEGKQRLIMKFGVNKSKPLRNVMHSTQKLENGFFLYKKFSLQCTCILPNNMDELCRRLSACSSLVQLDFSGGSLEQRSILNVLTHLPQMTALKLLNLSENLLRDDGMKPFAQLDREHWASTLVSLNHNKMTLDGALYLVAGMTTSAHLHRVEVSLGEEDRAVVHLAPDNSCDKSLSLRNCTFEVTHLQTLARSLCYCHQLVELDLSCNDLPAGALETLQKTLSSLNALRRLEIRNCGLNQQNIEALLKELDCSKRPLEIRVEEPWVMGQAAVNLVSCCLDLACNMQQIRVNGTTVNITLGTAYAQGKLCSDTPVPRVNIGKLASAVKCIGLVNCFLQGQHLTFLQRMRQRCAQLVELDLSQNDIGIEGAETLSSLLPDLQNLRKLRLEYKEAVPDQIRVLTVGLSRSASLEDLSLVHHVIDDYSAAALATTLPGLPRLRAINLSHCSNLTTVGARHLITGLTNCRSLEDVSLKGLQLEEEALVQLASELPNISSVRRLILSKIAVATSSTDSASGAVLLLLRSLEHFRRIEEIELDEMWMGDRGIQELAKHLPNWTGLRRISLCENNIADGGGEKLLAALTHCTALEEIILSGNILAGGSATRLSEVLPSMTCLRVLNLQHNQIQAAGGTALATYFQACGSLTDINLSGNPLGTEGAAALSSVLPHMPSLRKLHLVSVHTTELSSIAACLENCACAEDISLAWNGFGDDVALKLAEVLPVCQKLKRVDLESNKISVAGAEALAASLQSSSSIQVIRLWKNNISREEALRLSAKEPRLNFSLTLL
ncbi:NLR family, CARD domain containing 5 isoform X2 [Brienomyrus brachyistius]|uniref:NLR family, CARD domain containing 5 isoform X2 n=1 Tax=Brienomyrus brachyistius TaxID=42636 RepID=UPI0020B1A892|nr:NLR family, CARD domain containing 5 isoform X2 [Brienomyrus brachyistius]